LKTIKQNNTSFLGRAVATDVLVVVVGGAGDAMVTVTVVATTVVCSVWSGSTVLWPGESVPVGTVSTVVDDIWDRYKVQCFGDGSIPGCIENGIGGDNPGQCKHEEDLNKLDIRCLRRILPPTGCRFHG